MANLYVKASGSNTSPYDTWAKAATTLAAAVTAAAANDTIYMDSAMNDVITVSTTYTFAAGVSLISVSDTNEPPTTYAAGAQVSSTTAGVAITITAGAGRLNMYGMVFKPGSGSSPAALNLNVTDGSVSSYVDCTFALQTTNSNNILIQSTATTIKTAQKFYNCTFRFSVTGQGITVYSDCELYRCTIADTGSVPSTLFKSIAYNTARVLLSACDLSTCSGTLVGTTAKTTRFELLNCKLHASATLWGSGNTNNSYGELTAINCASGDTHYQFAHYNGLGSTTVSTSIYANDGAQFDGANRLSWVITGTSNATYNNPYISPWIDVYHNGTAAITPYLEIVRDGSSTAYKDDEVWSEWSYQGTSGSVQSTLVNDGRSLLGTAANQTSSSKTGADWTGENATAWFGKLSPSSSITPAEIGYIRVRVYVTGANTVYIDPQIRGLA